MTKIQQCEGSADVKLICLYLMDLVEANTLAVCLAIGSLAHYLTYLC